MGEQTLPPYRHELILGAMRRRKLTVAKVAQIAEVAPKTVVAVRGGDANVQLFNLKKIVEAVGLSMEEIFREDQEKAVA